MTLAYLGLGSNLGDRLGHLGAAVSSLADSPGVRLSAVSGVYRTDPVGYTEQPEFLNAVVEVETELEPSELLVLARSIEEKRRRRRGVRWGPRTLDIDILLYGDIEVSEADLAIPHAELANRRFVLEPLVEIAPGAARPDGTLAVDLLRGLHGGGSVHRDEELVIEY